MIAVEQLSKTYPSAAQPALDQVSLSIPDGDQLARLAARGPVSSQAVGEPKQAQAWLDRLAGA